MKKIIAICVCVVLLVAAFFIIDANKSKQGEKIPSEIFFPSADSEEDTSEKTNSTVKAESDEASSDSEDSSSLEESSSEAETEEVTYKKAEVLKVIKFTSVVDSGDEVILSLSGMPNTKYDIYVYYSSKPSADESLQPKYSDGEGNIIWKWNVPSSVKSGTKKIEIIGGGEILTLYIEII